MATGKELDELLQYDKQGQLRRKVKLYEWDQKQNVNTNDDGDDNVTPHFTACVALHNMHTHKYIH